MLGQIKKRAVFGTHFVQEAIKSRSVKTALQQLRPKMAFPSYAVDLMSLSPSAHQQKNRRLELRYP